MCMIYSGLLFVFSISTFVSSLYFLVLNKSYLIELFFFTLNSLNIEYIILLDELSLMFMSVVLLISALVIYYSEDYMSGDIYKNRFILLVMMFVLSMMFMILSPNLISILLGWDGLGLVSYCLVIYYQNLKSYNAGMLTALSNRIGDVALLMSIAWMLNFGSWNFIFYLEIMKNNMIMNVITLLVIIAAMTKSAQIPFSSWLPAAMAAPTPVSSLVHSSTLVTAGVYLLIRFNFSFTIELSYFLLLISCLTMFMSGLGANFEFDLKKIIALSTLSQLGLMMTILSLGGYKLAFYHLLTHALFKALLFMCAGNIIHNMINCQDIRYMGNLINQLPLTCTYLNICNWALCGLPFMSGFYSKDLIAEVMSFSSVNLFIYLIFYCSIGLTVAYSVRLSYYTLFGTFNFLSFNSLMESSLIMLRGMSGLIFFVIFGGSVLNWLIFSTPIFLCLSFLMKLMTLICVLLGLWLGYEISQFSMNYSSLSMQNLILSLFFSLMWNMPILSTLGVNFYPLVLSKLLYKNFDQGWYEYYGSQNLGLIFKNLKLQILSLNYFKIYLLMFLIWVMFLILNL
uniref:NADH-ubiquinone oxidoreductase chain 5 n=1 Tax=Agasicles hygrophila TaxID=715812 RepID=A0A0U2PQM3_9CUCU|nr:NADH dehydrogenase subunit 5 [Agasicles hygrophila]ALJ78618.1 NADH dehydrogenase subunit 5 [Agasicles hygrophila]ASO76774.1 NADH dehydrogenase subunit 5 [Agasicles hygrophila]